MQIKTGWLIVIIVIAAVIGAGIATKGGVFTKGYWAASDAA